MIVINTRQVEKMPRKCLELINSPPPNPEIELGLEATITLSKKQGRPKTSRGEACRSALSFSLLKAEMELSWSGLEDAYRDRSDTLNNVDQGASTEPANENLKEQGTFLRYGSGRQTPRAIAEGRLDWAKKRSAAFTAMYDSVLFDFLDLKEDEEGARVQFACWLWRTTICHQSGLPAALHQPKFNRRMEELLQAPRHYGEKELVRIRVRKKLPTINGRRFDASVIESFSATQKSAPSWVITTPYQDRQQLHHLSNLEHPDALCIMLFGVKYPGGRPDIRELALAGSEAWLTRWLKRYPRLGKGLRVFFDALGAQVEELKPFLASLGEFSHSAAKQI